ncbi:hypothetical protein ABT150_46880 [Streptomyces mirabilis]|uniref:hypothetical protein n=1 Tax=Streptomyces mirabilis TaxID=68239 RepID=UPI00332E3C14
MAAHILPGRYIGTPAGARAKKHDERGVRHRAGPLVASAGPVLNGVRSFDEHGAGTRRPGWGHQ